MPFFKGFCHLAGELGMGLIRLIPQYCWGEFDHAVLGLALKIINIRAQKIGCSGVVNGWA